jgi:hypothetical protein
MRKARRVRSFAVCRQVLMRLAVVFAIAIPPAVGSSQTTVLQLPATFVLPNYDRVFIGVAEAHEAGAYMARTTGAAATWYNGAGIASQERTSVAVNVHGLDVGTLSVPGTPVGSSTQFTAVNVLPLFIAVVLGTDVVPWQDVRIGISGTEQMEWSALAWWESTETTGHSTYVSDSSLSSYIIAGTVAWAVSPRLRVGGSIGFSFTRLYENDHFSALTTNTDVEGTVRNRLLSGLVFHFIPSVALQWEPATWLALGAVARAPGLRLWGQATVQGERQDTTSTTSQNTFLQTAHADFDYRYPLELGAAAAFRQEHWEVELDARYHASSGSYQLVGTGVPVETVTVPPGGPPVQSPFTPIQYQGRAVVDVALGGSWAASRSVRLHAGVYMSPSPVAIGSPFFRQTDLYGTRAGVSVRGEKLSGSIGLGYETGLSSASPSLGSGATTPIDDRVRFNRLSVVLGGEYRL